MEAVFVDFSKLKWSKEAKNLSQYLDIYSLPQIVKIEEGYFDDVGECSLSQGEILKLHTLMSEKKLLCVNKDGVELHIPVFTQKIRLKPFNYSTVYQRVVDLAHVKTLPSFVEVTRGYINVDHFKLSVDVGEILEVVSINQKNKKNRSMTFRNSDGALLKLPFECAAGFKPLVDNKIHLLSDVIYGSSYGLPFYFQFEDNDAKDLGVIEVSSVNDERLILASCGQCDFEVFFILSEFLKLKANVAFGSINVDGDVEYTKALRLFESDKPSYLEEISFSADHYRYSDLHNIQLCTTLKKKSESSTKMLNESEDRSDTHLSSLTTNQDESPINDNTDEEEYDEEHLYEVLDEVCAEAVQYSNLDHECFKKDFIESDIKSMSVEMLGRVLDTLHMGQHVKSFFDNQVDGSLFCELDDEELQDLGLNRFEVKKLNSFKSGWRPKLN